MSSNGLGKDAAGSFTCRICGILKENSIWEIQEMMFGLAERFHYFCCSICGCLQICEAPQDMFRYYPSEYYSYSPESPGVPKGIKGYLKNKRDVYFFFKRGLIGRFLSLKIITDEQLRSIAGINLTENSRILDVGCGKGAFLHELRKIGFKNLLGIDPFLRKDMVSAGGVRLKKEAIHNIGGKWDLIMFHHSFEHLLDPLNTLTSVLSLLSEGGVCLIRIPVVSSFSWEHYSVNWIQIDAPRHLYLFSVKGMEILASKAGFSIEKIVFDSTAFQFWGSEQSLKGIPLISDRSYFLNPPGSIFSEADIQRFRKRATELNAINQGDQAAFYLRAKKG